MAVKIDIVGASNFVDRMFEACGTYQWAREFLKNSLEARATRIEFGIEWQAVARFGVYRRTVMDNGCGMDADELVRFFSLLGAGAKDIGGLHENFGVGAKVASLPWNPDGVTVISYKNDRAAMIQIMLNPASGDYELAEFTVDGRLTSVIDPERINWSLSELDPDWAAVRPDWITHHGTVVVLMGSEQVPDTVLGNPAAAERGLSGLSACLNGCFWDLSQAEVRVVELNSDKPKLWPKSPRDTGANRRTSVRRIMGAQHWLTGVRPAEGRLAAQGTLALDKGRVETDWYLWTGERPAIGAYARQGGYIAVRYKDELFEVTQNKAHFRWFGVVESKVQQNLTVILRPQLYTQRSKWGIHADQSRNRLIFTGGGHRGVALPLSDWGFEFADKLPEDIRQAIREARGEGTGAVSDEEYRRRLQDRFGDRWRIRRLAWSKENGAGPRNGADAGAVTGRKKTAGADVAGPAGAARAAAGPRRKVRSAKRKLARLSARNGTAAAAAAAEAEAILPADVPRYRFGAASAFEKPWHIALWSPNDVDGPTVLINFESPILLEIIRHHQAKYPNVRAEEVAKTVLQVFGEVAACKIAHSQKLTRDITEQELDREYRSESALTVALMGLMSEESLIAQRLSGLGGRADA